MDQEKQVLTTNWKSAKRTVAFFSFILFLAIVIGGSIAFYLSMYQTTHETVGYELGKSLEIERTKLTASVNGEIAIAMKMAGSPLIQQYFMTPNDPTIQRLAFEEIAAYRRAFLSNSVFWVNDIDKDFWIDDDYVYTINPDNPDDYWYSMTLHETERYNFNINYNPDLDMTALWINAPVFDQNGTPIGVLGTGIDLTAFLNDIYRDYDGGGSLYFFNNLNEITGAEDSSLVMDKVTLDVLLAETGEEILAMLDNLAPNEIVYFASGENEVAVGEIPALGWYITAVMPLTISTILESPLTGLFVMMLIVIAAIFIIFFLFIFWLLMPLDGMKKTFGQITTDWNLTRQLKVKRRDETGALASFFNLTFEKIKNMIINIKTEIDVLSKVSKDLANDMNETASAVSQITANIQSIKSRIVKQSTSVAETNSTMEKITVTIDKLNGHVEKQTDSVAQSSSAIEEMLANIQSVTQTLIKNSGNVDELLEASEVGRTGLQEVASDIQEIAKESEGLLEINAVMENIASQTSLLSMNAAIEAAHAGEAGKGFAVVADEIRKLAVNSSNQSKTISEVLKKIKESIDKITVSTNNVLTRFEAIDSSVKTVAQQEENIRNAMEEQGQGSKQILEAIGLVNETTQLVKSGSLEMMDGAKEVIRESDNLDKATQEITQGMNEMASGADEINTAINHINDLSRQNQRHMDTLTGEISRFKVD